MKHAEDFVYGAMPNLAYASGGEVKTKDSSPAGIAGKNFLTREDARCAAREIAARGISRTAQSQSAPNAVADERARRRALAKEAAQKKSGGFLSVFKKGKPLADLKRAERGIEKENQTRDSRGGETHHRHHHHEARKNERLRDAEDKIKRVANEKLRDVKKFRDPENLDALQNSKPGLAAYLGQFFLPYLENKAKKSDRYLPDRPVEWRDPKQPRAKKSDETKLYNHNPGFCDLLPWVEYLRDSQCFLLEDGRSVGAIYELAPIGTEGRELSWLAKARDSVLTVLQNNFAEDEDAPWVAQFFCKDDQDFRTYMKSMRDYVQPRAKGTPYTQHFLATMDHHLESIAKPGGLFTDTRVTKEPWRGTNRRSYLVIYRRLPEGFKDRRSESADKNLNTVCERVAAGLTEAGVRTKRVDGEGFYNFLIPLFNPRAGFEGHPEIYRSWQYWEARPDETLPDGTIGLPPSPYSHSFAEKLFRNAPRSEPGKGFWYFDDCPNETVVVERLDRAPKIGALTGEIRHGDAMSALFDKLPEDTIMSLTLVVKPQDILEGHLNNLFRKAIGQNLASTQTREDVEAARALIGRGQKLYKGTLAFYIRGRDDADLHERHVQLETALQSVDLTPVPEGDEIAGLNTFLRWLPMGYNPLADKKDWYVKMMWAQHIANLCPVWGRATGTGHPGLSFYNRGGAPLTFDPLSRADRAMNAHLLVFGPTGAGKSATLTTMMSQLMAMYRPRLFIVEAGNSFGLLGQFFAHMGLTVQQVALKPGAGVSLAPFADARLLIEKPDAIQKPVLDEEEMEDEDFDAETSSADANPLEDKRDVMGELEITARLMITGGDPKDEEKFVKADKAVVRRALVAAAERCVREGRPILTQDVVAAMKAEAAAPDVKEIRSARISEMADAMSFYTEGFEGELFNRPGKPWPEADVTVVDLAHYAREGKEGEMAMAYIGLMNTVNNIAERDQMSGRPIVMVTDEGHIITKSPLVSGYAVKITKMWRKLGAWFWLATQNMADFPGAAKTMLNMIEWWVCLVMPKEEINDIARFKALTADQKAMLLSASKENNKYTEGVILSKNYNLLFRTVPPSLYLALAMTEPEEKKQRADIMKAHHCTELEAAFYVAEDIDRKRGIEPMPWKHLFAKNEG
jgi:conjugative transfer ATPase